MTGSRITINVTDTFGPDVQQGLRIFAEHSAISSYSTTPKDWEYWFNNNPNGNGVYSIAKDNDKVIGFCSLIPVKMFADGKIIRGAKAEFLVVLPEYRRAMVKSNTPLAFSVMSELYGNSSKFGIELAFAIATKVASVVHRLAGAVPMKYSARHYIISFKPADVHYKSKAKTLSTKYGAWIVSSLFYNKLKLKKGGAAFTVHSSLENIISKIQSDTLKNQLLYPDEKTMLFRFKENEYIIYEFSGNKFFIFTKPFENGKVYLRYWSSPGLPQREYASMYKDLAAKCKAAGAQSINLVIPEAENAPEFSKYGFIYKDVADTAFLYISNKKLNVSLNSSDWYLTDSHRGFV